MRAILSHILYMLKQTRLRTVIFFKSIRSFE